MILLNMIFNASTCSFFSSHLILIYVSDMSQAVKCDLYLYADDSCLLFQNKNVTEIKKKNNQRLQQDLSLVCRQ